MVKKLGRGDQARESRNSVLKLPVWLASVLQYPSWRVLARESPECCGKQHGELQKKNDAKERFPAMSQTVSWQNSLHETLVASCAGRLDGSKLLLFAELLNLLHVEDENAASVRADD